MIPPDRYQSLGELLRDAFVQFKTETALVELRRKRVSEELTYLETKRRGERIAKHFEDLGIGAGDRVAIVMSNQWRWLTAAYAAFYRGAVVVPLDYKLSGEEHEILLRHAKPKVLVTEYAEWRDLKATREGALGFERVLVSEVSERDPLPEDGVHVDFDSIACAEERARATFVPRKRSDQATLVYSSGTGGDPKGCILTHDNYLEQYRTLISLYPFRVGHRYFSVLPTNHAIDFMCGFLGAFACGATVVHQRTLRPEFLRHALQNEGITHMAIVPLILEAFERNLDEKIEDAGKIREAFLDVAQSLNASLTLDRPRKWLSKRLLRPVHNALGPDLKRVYIGGAFVDPARAQRFYDLGIPVVIGYGLTEAGTVLTVNDLKPFRPDSVGRPLEGVEIEIRNADAEGVGEVWVKSRTVFAGYEGDPEQTAEVLQDGWLRTGDLGYLDPSQQLHLVGRSKNMIVTAGGKNVYPEDIETAFEGLDCEEFAVCASGFLWPGIALDEEQLVLVARLKKEGSEADLLTEIAKRNRSLADYKRIAGVLFETEEFPRTASMKLKRRPLAEALRARFEKSALQNVQEVRTSRVEVRA